MWRASGSRHEDLFGLLGLSGLAVGLGFVPGPLAFGLSGAAAGIASQLVITLPAAIVTALASAANIAAGATLVRLARRAPFRSLTELVLVGFLGAVVLDIVLVCLLANSPALFTRPVLVVVHVLVLVLGWHAGLPMVAPRRPIAWRPSPLWALIGVAWAGPLLLQLASPVVPFFDVLPNHVAPVAHLATFGRLDPLTTSPSPAYGPSRLSLGYVSLLGTITTLTGLPAALSVSSFIAMEVVLVALGLRHVATTIGGGRAGVWALLAFSITQPFARLADDRSRGLVLPLVCLTLATLVRATRRSRIASEADRGSRETTLLAVGIGASILMHAVMGALAALAVLLTVAVAPGRTARAGIPALAAGAMLAAPQALVMLGVPMPPFMALAAIPMAGAMLHLLARQDVLRTMTALAPPAVAATALGLLLAIAATEHLALAPLLAALGGIGAVTLMGIVGLALTGRLASRLVLGAALGSGVIAALAAGLVASDDPSLLVRSIRFEVPKEVESWLPFVLSIAAAVAIDVGLRRCRAARLRRTSPASVRLSELGVVAMVGSLVVVAVVPWHDEPIDAYHVGEHRVSESLAIALRWAEHGYWEGYPDARQLVGAQQVELLNVLRREVAAGRIDAVTEVLHIASGFRQSVATPIGVFTGIIETTLSPDAMPTIHSLGSRLHPLTDLEAMLEDPRLRDRYVVLEPAGLPTSLAASIVGHGFVPIHANDRGIVFAPGSRAEHPVPPAR